jgi:zinc protease
MLVLDAALTGAKGLNIWSSFRGAPPQRRARLYTALVEKGLASIVAGSLLPTREPFLYSIGFTAMEGVSLASLEDAATQEIDRVRQDGLTEAEVARAKRQLRARLVFDNDSVTNVAHQLGYFETVTGPGFLETLPASVEAVTAAHVAEVASRYLTRERRTVGWFQPLERK